MTDAFTIGPKGQVVIPKALRDELGMHPGQRVFLDRDGSNVRVRRVLSLDELQGAFAEGRGGPDDLENEHRSELRQANPASRQGQAP